jgi:hypothetical protein
VERQRLTPQEKLEILQAIDNHRRWYSLDDQRACVICERVITGRQIEVRGHVGNHTLHCPTDGCPSNFTHWFLFQPPVKGVAPRPPETTRSEFDFLLPKEP